MSKGDKKKQNNLKPAKPHDFSQLKIEELPGVRHITPTHNMGKKNNSKLYIPH